MKVKPPGSKPLLIALKRDKQWYLLEAGAGCWCPSVFTPPTLLSTGCKDTKKKEEEEKASVL